jgi:mitogen-activated protein kinase organizer 1
VNQGLTARAAQSCLTNNDAYVVSGSEDGCVYFWELVEKRLVHKCTGHTGVVVSVDYHPTETCMLTASVDGSIRVWKK